MPHLTQKKINGKTYFYAEERKWVNGKSVRKWQKYLGSLDKIMQSVNNHDITINYSLVYEFGGVAAYLAMANQLKIEDHINKVVAKRKQGISIGRYLLLASINRGLEATSKNSMQEWFNTTFLLMHWPDVTSKALSSQRFWDNMEAVEEDSIKDIWQRIISHTIKAKGIDLSQICYDGTNYYTFISSFNARSQLPRRGKNKQGRADLRQINYALFCSQKDHIPLYFDVYEGNQHDSPEFYKVIEQFGQYIQNTSCSSNITIIFDKGNNAKDNIERLHQNRFNYIGSLKLIQAKELRDISNNSSCWKACRSSALEGVKYYRTQKIVYGTPMTLVMVYNPELYQAQTRTLVNDINTSCRKLGELKQTLTDRANGLVTRGRTPTLSGVKKQVGKILHRQFMKAVINVEYKTVNNIPIFDYYLDSSELNRITDTCLGKNILFTNNHHWSSEDIITAYRNQAVIENIFRESKDKTYGNWWPLFHYTDHKVKVHALYCTITLLLRSLLELEMRRNKIHLSMKRWHNELTGIKQVINAVNKNTTNRRNKGTQVMSLTRMNQVQHKLFKIFKLGEYVQF